MSRTGMAMSVFFYKDLTTSKTIIGCNILHYCVWYLCVLDIYGVVHPIQDANGYTYFNTILSTKEYKIHDKTQKLLKNHGLIL